jgi:hypothetical protein
MSKAFCWKRPPLEALKKCSEFFQPPEPISKSANALPGNGISEEHGEKLGTVILILTKCSMRGVNQPSLSDEI